MREVSSLPSDRLSMKQLVEDYLIYLKARYRPKTVERAKYCLNKLLGYCEACSVRTVKQLTNKEIRLLTIHLREAGYSNETVWGVGSTVRAFLNWCVREGHLKESPIRQGDIPAKPKPKPQPLSEEELHRVLNACTEAGWVGDRNYAIIITLAYTGLRRGELVQMRYGDLAKGYVTVVGKGDEQRRVYLGETVLTSIHKYLSSLRAQRGIELDEDDPLWLDKNLTPLRDDNIRRTLDRIGKRVGIDLYAHRLRDTCATMWLANGASTEAVRAILGHKDTRSIQAYSKLSDVDLKRIMEQTDPLRNKGIPSTRKVKRATTG